MAYLCRNCLYPGVKIESRQVPLCIPMATQFFIRNGYRYKVLYAEPFKDDAHMILSISVRCLKQYIREQGFYVNKCFEMPYQKFYIEIQLPRSNYFVTVIYDPEKNEYTGTYFNYYKHITSKFQVYDRENLIEALKIIDSRK